MNQAQSLPLGVGGGLVAIKTLLSRDPCAHATVAIQMIDAILAEHPAQPQQKPVAAVAWQQGYDQGVADERISEANIGIAGFNAKVNPARNNPYTSPQPAQRKQLTTQEIHEWWASENGLEDCEMCKLDDFEKVVRAIEAKHGIKGDA